MISPQEVAGAPRPVGSEFRQRSVSAASPRKGFSEFDNHDIPWTVSVVDTLRGPVIEAHAFHQQTSIVATDVTRHSMMPDVIAKARDLLDADGWTMKTVAQCGVKGCENPLPMWTEVRRGQPNECLACSLRSILACTECGAPDNAHYIGREAMLERGLCFACNLWRERAEQGVEVVTDNWIIYGIGDGARTEVREGFGGRKHVVTFTDGREVETDDLWYGGEIPEWFRDRFTVNAVVRGA